jgi:hypothetical protein
MSPRQVVRNCWVIGVWVLASCAASIVIAVSGGAKVQARVQP